MGGECNYILIDFEVFHHCPKYVRTRQMIIIVGVSLREA